MITFNKIYNVSRDRLRVETATDSFLWNNNRLREWFSVPYNPVESSINFATDRSAVCLYVIHFVYRRYASAYDFVLSWSKLVVTMQQLVRHLNYLFYVMSNISIFFLDYLLCDLKCSCIFVGFSKSIQCMVSSGYS